MKLEAYFDEPRMKGETFTREVADALIADINSRVVLTPAQQIVNDLLACELTHAEAQLIAQTVWSRWRIGPATKL